MIHLTKIFLAILFLTLTVAFTVKPNSGFIGIYGVSENDPSQIKLTVNSDNTFSFQDFSNPDAKIDVNGKWELKKNTIWLISDSSNTSFHNKWRFTKSGQVAKSRKGMTFYSLLRQ